ncbi:hypothetical protein [Jeotgalibacillus aurantiacus]|uniref:hypothetical protein n=1 Tax=Jeotgalibacillus aurantiacus TaxID=2763266 RepID=UPI001D0A25D3|nr:hypothetical protein [Jeotgalibacillus aurantiacus]
MKHKIVFYMACLFVMLPLILWSTMNANPGIRMTFLNGPFPFSHLGGGPFQLAFYSSLVMTGVLLFGAGVRLRNLQK